MDTSTYMNWPASSGLQALSSLAGRGTDFICPKLFRVQYHYHSPLAWPLILSPPSQGEKRNEASVLFSQVSLHLEIYLHRLRLRHSLSRGRNVLLPHPSPSPCLSTPKHVLTYVDVCILSKVVSSSVILLCQCLTFLGGLTSCACISFQLLTRLFFSLLKGYLPVAVLILLFLRNYINT